MLDSLIRTINKWASFKIVLPLLGVTLTLMIVVNRVRLPITVPRIREVSQGADILDMHMYYSKSEAYSMLERLQPEGRRVYSEMLMGFDFVFPAVYAITFALIVSMLFRSKFSAHPFIRVLVMLPLAAGLFDWSENMSILAILFKYPAISDAAYAAGLLTLGKWIFIWLSLAVVLIGLLYKLKDRSSPRPRLE
ncbi:hypothetical protein [Paenibacillus sp. NFR01]|uniref:hypothetical protein n=1 Tax=Paenibacillus sp. NFR01 TaxID=1566279 RepID=UPI0008D4B77A|nr:hypothetical protein [Paenibacillus sp. NFR01]SEU09313.1 hypothetical protein SAMN03159358_3256 [Paenibacillus sp. NFR01]